MQKLRSLFNREKNANGTVTYFLTIGDSIVNTSFDNPKLATEGYMKNIAVYNCISRIADQVSQMNMKLFQTDSTGALSKQVEQSELLDLLKNPYPTMRKSTFLNRVVSHKLIYGNYYIEKIYNPRNGIYQKRKPIQIRPLRPDYINVIEGQNGINSEYRYTPDQGQAISFKVTALGASNIIHGMTFNPDNDFMGMSPMLPAGYSIDTHNEISKQNYRLVKNGVRPSGILTIPSGVSLDESQKKLLKADLKEKYQGATNSGEPLVLNNGMTWTQISINSNDSEINQVKKDVTHEIALAYKTPLELMNTLPAKYDNLNAAWEQLYYDMVLPISNDIIEELNSDLVPFYGENLVLVADFSHTKVMREAKLNLHTKINNINHLTPNEKRKLVDYEPIEGGDELKQSSSDTQQKTEYIADQMSNGLTYDEAVAMEKLIYG
jgi:HK97 family phage portal protein